MMASSGTVVQVAVPTYHVDVVVRNGDLQQFDALVRAQQAVSRHLATMVRDGLDITADELFGHAICQELGNVDGRRTRKELEGRIDGLKGFVMRDLPGASGALVLTSKPGEGVVEYLGVGTGLAVVDRLLTLDSSYFRRIPERRGAGRKTMDFDGVFRASTGREYVQIEAKGRTNPDDEDAWNDIAAKKDAYRKGRVPRPAGIGPLPADTPTHLIGTVAEIPKDGQGTTRIIIGDPPIPAFDGDPSRAKLLQRLWFYQRALAVFQPRGALLAALSERIGTLTRPEVEWQKFDGQRLFNGRMEEWELAATIADTVRVRRDDQFHGRSVLSRKRTRGSGVEGESASRANEPFFFLGLHRDVLLALARQDFKVIADYRYDRRHIRAEINDLPRLMYQHPSGLIVSAVADVRAIDERSIRESF